MFNRRFSNTYTPPPPRNKKRKIAQEGVEINDLVVLSDNNPEGDLDLAFEEQAPVEYLQQPYPQVANPVDNSQIVVNTLPPVQEELPSLYTIQKGDTLSKIARETGMSIQELAELNNIKDINKIYAGANLKLSSDVRLPKGTSNNTVAKKGGTKSSPVSKAKAENWVTITKADGTKMKVHKDTYDRAGEILNNQQVLAKAENELVKDELDENINYFDFNQFTPIQQIDDSEYFANPNLRIQDHPQYNELVKLEQSKPGMIESALKAGITTAEIIQLSRIAPKLLSNIPNALKFLGKKPNVKPITTPNGKIPVGNRNTIESYLPKGNRNTSPEAIANYQKLYGNIKANGGRIDIPIEGFQNGGAVKKDYIPLSNNELEALSHQFRGSGKDKSTYIQKRGSVMNKLNHLTPREKEQLKEYMENSSAVDVIWQGLPNFGGSKGASEIPDNSRLRNRTPANWKTSEDYSNWLNYMEQQGFKNGGIIGNIGDEIELTPQQINYYKSLGYEFE
jgi:LysM repeat protein